MNKKKNYQFSIELFPPKDVESEAKLDKVFEKLLKLKPHFFSITYGAGGSTKKGTQELVLRYQKRGATIAPHISFGGLRETAVSRLLKDYEKAGVKRVVALRGDLLAGSTERPRHANELVEFIRRETGDQFHIDVACYPEVHPESTNIDSEIKYFKRKIDAGADSAITQYFYNTDAYFRFRDHCYKEGIHIPIVPGVMPITNYQNLSRFSASCGAEIPRWLRFQLEKLSSDKLGLREFGVEVMTELCWKLVSGGAPGLHFYSMNLASSVMEVWNNLGLAEKGS